MFIHLGLMRCASTFLQNNVFPLSNERYVSNELLSGNPSYPKMAGIEFRDMILKGVYGYYGDVKIIIAIRDKDKWVKSLYNQYVKTGFFYSYDKWYNIIFDKRFLDFYDYISNIKKMFSDVFIFDLEVFNIKDLCYFIGVDYNKVNNEKANRSLTSNMINTMRIYNFIKEAYLYTFEGFK